MNAIVWEIEFALFPAVVIVVAGAAALATIADVAAAVVADDVVAVVVGDRHENLVRFEMIAVASIAANYWMLLHVTFVLGSDDVDYCGS